MTALREEASRGAGFGGAVAAGCTVLHGDLTNFEIRLSLAKQIWGLGEFGELSETEGSAPSGLERLSDDERRRRGPVVASFKALWRGGGTPWGV